MARLDTSDLKQVGEFPTPAPIIRSRRNPLDVCTVVSIFPVEIHEVKHTIFPGEFRIPKGSFDDPSILQIESSSWFREETDRPTIEVISSSVEIAESIVKDYCIGMLGCNMPERMPGLFFVLGRKTQLEIKLEFKESLEKARISQNAWYLELVRIADSLWSRSNGNPLVIWDEMRLAARSLNLNEKPWLRDYQIIEKTQCFACGSMKDPKFPVCAVCRAVDPNHVLAKEVKFAG